VIQGLEFGSKGLIAYSLGNFIFDQLWEATKQGLILEAACDRQGLKQIRLTPIMIREEQPVVAEGVPARQIMQEVASVSQGLNN
jgi:poly-gamma-glutamate capsule biosynthesis protein CapA/YwtB (metallophosphatase superfamily)